MEFKVNMKNPKKKDYVYEEAIKTLRTNLLFSGKQLGVIMLTSCFPNEGKSETAFTLAQEIGNIGKKVLLLDADIRKSVYVTRYDVRRKVHGLSQFLSGQIERSFIIYHTNFANLDIIFAGPVAPNPSELLSDTSFEKLLNDLKSEYDYVIIDTPPISNLADGVVIASKCDGAIFVIESGVVSQRVIQKAKQQIEASGCRVLGAVLNKVDIKKDKYYSHYYKKYGAYYKENKSE